MPDNYCLNILVVSMKELEARIVINNDLSLY